jgi:hypothetical protein
MNRLHPSSLRLETGRASWPLYIFNASNTHTHTHTHILARDPHQEGGEGKGVVENNVRRILRTLQKKHDRNTHTYNSTHIDRQRKQTFHTPSRKVYTQHGVQQRRGHSTCVFVLTLKLLNHLQSFGRLLSPQHTHTHTHTDVHTQKDAYTHRCTYAYRSICTRACRHVQQNKQGKS